ncbi:UNKNOWN [Stylonychia lemnae]|uniref:Uncharacterized protein n=1 Tax=Stylonychia lemnae TaxID=5949 RepID=A0A078A5F7_STYLE|nr:UNKNOWN [Stylonychia lemnae]|eukprot:CDW77404.1 UNKNOWN [Stylonychia lemnae]
MERSKGKTQNQAQAQQFNNQQQSELQIHLANNYQSLQLRNQRSTYLCEELENIIYNKLDNYRDETEYKYKKLKQKQLSLEQEKKLEEEINKKLSGLDKILNKALSINPSIFTNGQHEEEKIVNQENSSHNQKPEKSTILRGKKPILSSSQAQQKTVKGTVVKNSNQDNQASIVSTLTAMQEEPEEQSLDLYRIYRNDNEIKTKSQALTKIRDLKKQCRDQVKSLMQQEDTIKSKCDRKLKKLTQLSRLARSKYQIEVNAQQQKNQEYELIEINQLCANVVEHQKKLESGSLIIKSGILENKLNQFQNAQRNISQQFYDYYALWVLNKRLSETQEGIKRTKVFIIQNIEVQRDLFKNTFIIDQTLSLVPKKTQTNEEIQNHILEQCEDELLELYKESLKSLKAKPINVETVSVDQLLNSILNNKQLLGLQKKIREILSCLDMIEDFDVQSNTLDYAIKMLQGGFNALGNSGNGKNAGIKVLQELIRAVGVRQNALGSNNSTKMKYNLIIYQ